MLHLYSTHHCFSLSIYSRQFWIEQTLVVDLPLSSELYPVVRMSEDEQFFFELLHLSLSYILVGGSRVSDWGLTSISFLFVLKATSVCPVWLCW